MFSKRRDGRGSELSLSQMLWVVATQAGDAWYVDLRMSSFLAILNEAVGAVEDAPSDVRNARWGPD